MLREVRPHRIFAAHLLQSRPREMAGSGGILPGGSFAGGDDVGAVPVPGIYNYCHRWCERCRFTDRCAIYAGARGYDAAASGERVTDADTQSGLDPVSPEASAFLRELDEAQRSLTPQDYAELERDRRRIDALVEGDPLVQAAQVLARTLWQSESVTAADVAGDAVLLEAIEVVNHYGLMIEAKVSRAVRGLCGQRFEGPDDVRDADGSAKVGLLALEELGPAVQVLALALPGHQSLRLAFAMLPVVRALLEDRFPAAMSFVRPGFDEAGDGQRGG
jgi:hypothetical protein